TTIITFLMVFLIQNTQNRDMLALQVKLDELVRAIKAARNTVLNLEELDDAELELLIQKYERLGRHAQHKREQRAGAEVVATECPDTPLALSGQLQTPASEGIVDRH